MSARELTDRIVARSRRGQPPVAAEEVAAFAREAAALGDADLAATLWGTYEMTQATADAAVRAAEAIAWSEPINDPRWNR